MNITNTMFGRALFNSTLTKKELIVRLNNAELALFKIFNQQVSSTCEDYCYDNVIKLALETYMENYNEEA